MPKARLLKLQAKTRRLIPWYLLALALVFASVSVYSLRQNNLHMIKLRDQVFAADKAGGDVETALKNLREYIYSHMNTDLDTATGVKPPIQLKYTYDRLLQAEKTGVNKTNAQVYTDAQHYCEALYPASFSGRPRVPCIKAYVSSHGVQVQPIADSLYKFDFVSPTWTPDLAGLTLLATILFFGLFCISLGLELWLKHELHNLL